MQPSTCPAPRCGKLFFKKPGQIYCSRECVNASIREGRSGSEYIAWKRGVVDRASGICEMCHRRDGRRVFAHHIIPISDLPELKLVSVNGMCVCVPCHDVIHDQVGNVTLRGERGLYGAKHRKKVKNANDKEKARPER